MAVIVLQDPETGYPLAVMDGGHITNLRTGAAIAVCAKHYAKPGASTVAMIGAGTQARFALEALTHVFDLKRVIVRDIRPEAAAEYATEASTRFGIEAQAVEHVEEAVRGCDVVVTVTYADEPLIEDAWLSAGVTAISAGSFQEFADDAVRGMDKLIVDSWEQCAHRGELKRFAERNEINRDAIHAEVGETVCGIRSGRESVDERILVVPIGLGSHDIAVARTVYEASSLNDGGTNFRFFDVPTPAERVT
jgi:ornithine cyclodeaminase/alanine dehydrogenase-like protein (mu-crystallin family)